MGVTRWMLAVVAAVLMLNGDCALAQGHGHGKGHAKHEDNDDQGGRYYREGDVREWYDAHQNDLPPGLAKKDRLPPGLEKQLARRGTLPPGLQKRLQPCPYELERRLPPPPPDCSHVLVGGHLVLLNRRTDIVVDIVHFDIR